MKFLKRFLPFFVSFNIFLCFFFSYDLTSYAVDSQFLVQKHYASFGQSNFSFHGTGAYYTIANPTGLTPCSVQDPYYYYSSDNATFDVCTGEDMLTNIANLGLGILLSEFSLNNLKGYFTAITGAWNFVTVNGEQFFQDGLYDLNHNFYGFVLTDISGCYYSFSNLSSAVTVPGYQVTNVYNYINSDPNIYNRIIADPFYIDFQAPSFSDFKDGYVSDTFDNSFDSIFSNFSRPICTGVYRKNSSDSHFIVGGTFGTSYDDLNLCLLAEMDSNTGARFDYFCWYYNLVGTNTSVSWTDLVNFRSNPKLSILPSEDINDYVSCYYDLCDSSNPLDIISNGITFSFYNNGSYSSNRVYNGLGDFRLGFSNVVDIDGSSYDRFLFPIAPDGNTVIRIFGDSTTQYDSNTFNSNSFNNFDSANNNSYNTTSQNLDNSVTNNNISYNSVNNSVSNSSYSNPISSSVINNSVINNITNNYGSSPNNSEIVDDNGNGSGGSGGSDSSVLDKFLEMILKFFEAVAKIFSAVLTGLLEMFTIIIEAITDLMSDITPFTQFLGVLFGFLPSPIPQVLAIGFSICVLCAVISFIRGG